MNSGENGAAGGQAVKDGAAAEAAPAGPGDDKAGDELARLSAERDDYRNKLLYMQADFENYKKRVARDRAEDQARANGDLIKDLLEPYENLGRALEAANKPSAERDQISKGLEMVYGQMKGVLERYGLKPIETIGKQFDPRTMEALLQEAAPIDEDTVLEEFQRGYTLNSKVIRCAKVKVSRK